MAGREWSDGDDEEYDVDEEVVETSDDLRRRQRASGSRNGRRTGSSSGSKKTRSTATGTSPSVPTIIRRSPSPPVLALSAKKKTKSRVDSVSARLERERLAFRRAVLRGDDVAGGGRHGRRSPADGSSGSDDDDDPVAAVLRHHHEEEEADDESSGGHRHGAGSPSSKAAHCELCALGKRPPRPPPPPLPKPTIGTQTDVRQPKKVRRARSPKPLPPQDPCAVVDDFAAEFTYR